MYKNRSQGLKFYTANYKGRQYAPIRRLKIMQLNGSEIIAECLLEQGVDTVFGYPGGAVLNIYDALYKYSTSRELPMQLTAMQGRQENAAL